MRRRTFLAGLAFFGGNSLEIFVEAIPRCKAHDAPALRAFINRSDFTDSAIIGVVLGYI